MEKLRIIVGGFIGLYPTGGATWDYLQYPLGLHMMGHDVYYIEDTVQYRAEWKSNETWLDEIEQNIINLKARVKRGGDFDKWDIKTRNGLFSTAKGIITVEEHGANQQYVKLRYWAKYSLSGLLLIAVLVAITTFSAMEQSWLATSFLSIPTAAVTTKYILDSASVVHCIVMGFKSLSAVVKDVT